MEQADPGGGSLTLASLIDKAGDGLVPDLKREFNHDLSETIHGRGPAPAVVLSYVRALPEASLTKALLRDDPASEGWDHDRYLLAGIFDVIRENTLLTGHFNKAPELKQWPRPGDEPSENEGKKPVSVKALWAHMSTQ